MKELSMYSGTISAIKKSLRIACKQRPIDEVWSPTGITVENTVVRLIRANAYNTYSKVIQ